MNLDFIMNGLGHGDIAQKLLATDDLDPGVLRPWYCHETKKSYVTVNAGYKYDPELRQRVPQYKNIVVNAPSILPLEGWAELDSLVQTEARAELRVVGDLNQEGLTYNLGNGMGTIMLQYRQRKAKAKAETSMDGLRRSDRDRPTEDFKQFPIPLHHGEFSFSLRDIRVSARSGIDLQGTQAAEVGRAIGERIEGMTLGTLPAYSYGGVPIYGMLNHPNRILKTITNPTANGWTPKTLVDELRDAFQVLRDARFRGPFGVYMSYPWAKYMNMDYNPNEASAGTLQSRLQQFTNVKWWRELETLGGFRVVIIHLDRNNIRMVNGLPLTPFQWETQGGLEIVYKAVTIQVCQLIPDINGVLPIVDAAAA